MQELKPHHLFLFQIYYNFWIYQVVFHLHYFLHNQKQKLKNLLSNMQVLNYNHYFILRITTRLEQCYLNDIICKASIFDDFKNWMYLALIDNLMSFIFNCDCRFKSSLQFLGYRIEITQIPKPLIWEFMLRVALTCWNSIKFQRGRNKFISFLITTSYSDSCKIVIITPNIIVSWGDIPTVTH